MPVFNYNVVTPMTKYSVEERGHRNFVEDLPRKNAPRREWMRMLACVRREKELNKKRLYPERVYVRIQSLEALQTENEEHMKQLIKEVLNSGAKLLCEKEDAVFSREHPNGVANDPQKLEEAQKRLRATWGIPIPNGRKPFHRSSVIEI